MLKLLIADDEKMICLLISRLLDWEKLGYEIVGMAYTGIDAFEMIIKEKPDVVISDIRMPGYDGLELIRKTKETGLETEFVMISGYKQFEYAQSAMKYGVKYYLLKPIQEDKLQEIALEVKTAIYNKKEREVYENNLEQEIKATRDKMKKRFLTSIYFDEGAGFLSGISDRNVINQEYSTSFQEGIFQAVFVKLDMKRQENEIHTIISKIEKYTNVLKECCEEYITIPVHSGTITLMNYKSEQQKIIRKKIEEMYENILHYVESFEGFSVFAGVGEKGYSFQDSRYCLKTAADAIKYRISISGGGIIYSEDYKFTPYDLEKIVTAGARQSYMARLSAGDIDGAVQNLISQWREIHYRRDNYSPVLIYDLAMLYVDMLSEYCKNQDYYKREYEERLKDWHMQIDNAGTEKEIMDRTEVFIVETLEKIEYEKKQKDVKPIRVIKKYIEEHFMEEVSLQQLAEIVDMNASYVSSVFKKETGQTYSEYLLKCRIDHASRLLVDTGKSIREIGEECGYQDTRYFSKQFLKQVGLKPSEYRKLYS